jgi:hypothetical protein
MDTSRPKDRRRVKSIKGVSATRSTAGKPSARISSWTVCGDRTKRGYRMGRIVAAGAPIFI